MPSGCRRVTVVERTPSTSIVIDGSRSLVEAVECDARDHAIGTDSAILDTRLDAQVHHVGDAIHFHATMVAPLL